LPVWIYAVIAWEEFDLKARDIAFGSIYSALSIILVSSSAIFGDDLFLLIFSSLPLIALTEQFGKRAGVISYAVISAVVFLIFPLRISTMIFILLFGPYSLLRELFKNRKILRITFHFVLLFGLAFLSYFVITYLLNLNLGKYSVYLVALGILGLLLYERFVEYFVRWYKKIVLKQRWM
jgi:hypothetical protein